MLKKFLAAKTAAVTTVLALGVVAAGATAGVVDGPADPQLDETTTTLPEDTTTTVPEETTTTSVPEDTTTTTSVPEETTTTTVPETPEPLTFERGPDPTGPAHHGLCRAFGHRSEGPGRSVAADNLRAAAANAGQSVQEFCADVLGGDESDSDEPTADDRAAASERTGRPDHAGQGNKGKGKGNGRGRG